MSTYETYSMRKKAAARSGQPDVFVYDQIPKFLRQQIIMIWRDSIGPYGGGHYYGSTGFNASPIWDRIVTMLSKEIEPFHNFRGGETPAERCEKYLLNRTDVDECLDLIELTCRAMLLIGRNDPRERGAKTKGMDGVTEINARFRQHGVGYQFENGSIVRMDSQFTHAEVIMPSLALLAETGFEKANEDFMTAHRHLRHGENQDAITAANRAFESALKAICASRSWKYGGGARASDLIKVVRRHGLLPDYLDAGLDTYVAMLKTGLPKVRDNAGGHGSAPDAPNVAEHLATYAISMAAANIRLVIEAHKALA